MPMQVFTVGQVLAAADVNEYLVNTRYAAKASDTNRISTTTLAADPDLTLPADANKSYLLELFLQYSSASAAGLKYNFTFPSGATLNGGAVSQLIAAGTQLTTYDQSGSFGPGVTITATALGIGLDNWIQVRGILVTSGTAGAFTLQWAQSASTASNTTVRAGSAMLLRRVS